MEFPIQFSKDFFRIFMVHLQADRGSITFNPAKAPSHKAPEPPNPPPPNPILSEPPVSEPPISEPHPGPPPSMLVDPSVDNPDDLSLKGHYTQMVKNPLNIGTPHIAPHLAPKPVLNPAHGQGFHKKLQQTVLKETVDAEFQEILQIIAIAADKQNPFACKARNTIANIYQDVVAQMAPSIPANNH
ncbi:hypothetical protein FS749_007684 [Ceratobasidium sp. UAMH 11750]|nr:hypothetical protein FS749_007684 [Ceratobasidium sp. UAMH 11750]